MNGASAALVCQIMDVQVCSATYEQQAPGAGPPVPPVPPAGDYSGVWSLQSGTCAGSSVFPTQIQLWQCSAGLVLLPGLLGANLGIVSGNNITIGLLPASDMTCSGLVSGGVFAGTCASQGFSCTALFQHA